MKKNTELQEGGRAPGPQGFPRISLEGRMRDMLSSKREEHWSFDQKADAKNKERNKALRKMKEMLEKSLPKELE